MVLAYYRYGDLRRKGASWPGASRSPSGNINDVGIEAVKIDDTLMEEETGEVYRYGLYEIRPLSPMWITEWLPIP